MGQTAVKQIEELNEVSLTGVVPIGQELGRGAYGRVFTVNYSGEVCAAKEIHPLLIDEGVSPEEREAIKRDFVRECLCCSTICHPAKHSEIQRRVLFKPVPGDDSSGHGDGIDAYQFEFVHREKPIQY